MKQSSINRFSVMGSFVAVLMGGLFVFQNCADPLNLATQDQASVNDTLPFPYQVQMDTLSYMSCSGVTAGYDPRAVYTFRLGAYSSNKGIGLSPQYQSSVSTLTPAQISQALQSSLSNQGSQLELAIRLGNDYQTQILTANQGNSVLNNDYGLYLGPMNSQTIADRISQLPPNKMLNYVAGIPGLDGRLLESSLRFLGSETLASSVRSNLMGNNGAPAILALTYTQNLTDPISSRSPTSTRNDRAYGIGYQLAFRAPNGFSSAANRVLNSVTEIDLTTNQASGANLSGWSCVDTLVVARNPNDCTLTGQDDSTGIVNAPLVAPLLNAPRLARIRNVLRAEDWYVDSAHSCVLPKNSSLNCYGNISSSDTRGVAYSGACSEDPSSGLPHCPHYVSICYRNN